MKIKTITAGALAAVALLVPAAAEAAPRIGCSWGVVSSARCTAIDRRMARQLAVKVFRRIDADWNIGPARNVDCDVSRAPRVWKCVVGFTDGNGKTLLAPAFIRRGGGVRVTGVCRVVTDAGCVD